MRDDDQTYLSSLRDTAKFFYYRGHGHLFRFLVNRVKWHVYPRLHIFPQFPDHIDIESSSACNMKCPMCFTTTDEYKESVTLTNMKFELFKKIVDECVERGAFSIRLSWRGEPTLNPRYVDMARYAKSRGIKEVSSLTNLLKMTPEMFEELVDIQMDWLTISFDGLGDTYNKIRHPAKFEDAVEKIRQFSEIKKRKGSRKPVIKIQGIWPAVKENPQAFYNTFRDIADQVAVNPLLDYLRKDTDIVYRDNFTCPLPWQRFAVGADGKVGLCAHDEMGHQIMGDVNKQTIHEIWNGPAMSALRKAHVEHTAVKQYEACRSCFLPRASVPVSERVGERIVVIKNMVNRTDRIGQ